MKKITIIILFLFVLINVYSQKHDPDSGYRLTKDTLQLNEVTINAFSPYQANSLMPITFKNITKADLSLKNYGQEPSLILNTTPSIISYSESGGDWGYSYIRLRGIDQTRINFTLNGVPLNEPEDQGVYFSNYPNFFESVEMLQIQRGTGMTKNGSSSFVGSMNFESYKPAETKVGVYLGYGGDNTFKLSMNAEKNWRNGGLYVSIADIQSDGYKEHSGNHSRSAFLVGNYKIGKNQFKFVGFAGEQMNQLAWLGAPMDSINVNRRYNANTEREVDHFNQYHLQFHHTYNINNTSRFNYTIYYNFLTGWYTYDGNHFGSSDLFGYNLKSNFLGTNLNYYKKLGRLDLYTGINGYKYSREHKGTTNNIDTYTNTGYRDDFSAFLKGILNCGEWNFYGDLQYRYTSFIYDGDISYDTVNRNSKPYYNVSLQHFNWNFFNFSGGVEYKINHNILYYSIGKTHREPIRNDMFYGNDYLPCDTNGNALILNLKPESVLDQEFGYRYIKGNMTMNINIFYMMFQNEMVLTGTMGNTGLPLKINVPESYRSGLEFDFKYRWKFGLTLQQNMSYNHSEITWGNKKSVPVLTPQWLSNTELNYNYKWFLIGLSGRYQSFSYIDQNNNYTIPSFYTLNAMVGLKWKWGEWNLFINNFTGEKYYSNGMMGYNNLGEYIPLYFVSEQICIFTGLKLKLSN